ncbi:MAG: DUF2027 domain-containing protein [Bacteroidota bacterium]|nr:DUF2027 domain-containing protein [Bacteroidota bacterium]
MKFKVGDRVNFLNEKGGGVVKKILSPTLVNVEIEEGFDVPVMTSELVPDERRKLEEASRAKSDRKPDREESFVEARAEDEPGYDDRKSPIDKVGFRGSIAEGIYLAFVPHDQRWLVTGEMDILLINNTGWDVLFSFFLEDDNKGFAGIDYDMLEPRTRILLETIEREELEKWTRGVVQCIFHAENSHELPLPANCDFKIKASRIYKEGNYRETPLVSEKAFLFNLMELSLHGRHEVSEKVKKYRKEEELKQQAREVRKEEPIDKHRVGEGIAVVDLHIGELLDNILGLSSADMLKIQKDYFIRMLENAIRSGYQKVTFIHGVGNGVLKNEIVRIMKEYEGLDKQSASLAKFGVGAIDVIIKDQ